MSESRTTRDASYTQQVNRHLASAKWLLNLAEAEKPKLPPFVSHSLMESALVQTYYLFFSYCNEILSHYRRPVIEEITGAKTLSFLENDQRFQSIYEIDEIKELMKREELLGSLMSLPHQLLTLKKEDGDEHTHEEQPEPAQSLIRLVNTDMRSSCWEVDDIQYLLSMFSELIEKQRESMSEY